MVKSYSQYGQDIILNGLFEKDYKGIFVDIGAYDGISLSNTYLLEQHGWNGVCIEPNPETFKKLMVNRNCTRINMAVADGNGSIDFVLNKTCDFMSGYKDTMLESNITLINDRRHEVETTQVPCVGLNEMLEIEKLFDIDVMSIDIEGAEYILIQHLDFSKFKVKVFVIENNNGYGTIYKIMKENGYGLFATIGQDNIYVKDLMTLAPYHNYTQLQPLSL